MRETIGMVTNDNLLPETGMMDQKNLGHMAGDGVVTGEVGGEIETPTEIGITTGAIRVSGTLCIPEEAVVTVVTEWTETVSKGTGEKTTESP